MKFLKNEQWTSTDQRYFLEFLFLLHHSLISPTSLKVLDFHEFGVLDWVAEVVANSGMRHEAAAIVGEKIYDL